MSSASSEQPWRANSAAVFATTARAFGERMEDIEMDFARLSRPDLVSALLVRCLCAPSGHDTENVGSWSLGQRLQGLIAIAQASDVSRFTVVETCGNCGERLEIPIAMADFARAEPATGFDWLSPTQTRLSVSVPTGDDQKRWLRMSDVTQRALARELIRNVDGEQPTADWDIPDAWIDHIAAELDRNDPFTALELDSRCPACNAEVAIPLDLEAELLRRFAARQRRTLEEIHLLATRYHWSESEILRLPAWRRSYYLAAATGGEP